MSRKKREKKTVADFPELVKQWHATKNEELTPNIVSHGSRKRIWWKCSEGPDHEWESVVKDRTSQKQGCPFCAGRRVSVTNSLANLYPELVEEWHPTKNIELTPNQIVSGSSKEIWWKCPEGPDHEWKMALNRRTRQKQGCPFCRGMRISVTNSLANLYPEIAKEWHPTKNKPLTPKDIVAGSHKKVWWKCEKGPDHEWEAVVKNRTKLGHSCPFCIGRKASITNSLVNLHPDLAAEWHPTKNQLLTPKDIAAGSSKKVWWKCPEGSDHEWEATASSRTTKRGGTGCPYCRGLEVSITNSLVTLYPKIAKEWHPTKNQPLTPKDIVAGSHKKVWWKCPKGRDHEWKQAPSVRTGDVGCPFCAGKRVSITNSLDALHPEIAKEWHPTKNGKLTPKDIVAGSNKKVWWKCPNGFDHEWEATPNKRTRKEKSGCPFCVAKKVSMTNSLANLFPEIAKEWHPTKNYPLTPKNIVAGSHKKVWWKCPEGPDHEWEVQVFSRTGKDTTSCPFCVGRRLSVTNSLAQLFPEIAKEWHPTKNGVLTPNKVVAGSKRIVWWKCTTNPNHEWEVKVQARTSKGTTGCPFCNQRWTVENIRLFVTSLLNHLASFEPYELYMLFIQNGLYTMYGKSRGFIKSLATGRFPVEELKKFVNKEISLVDDFIEDPSKSLEDLKIIEEEDINQITIPDKEITELIDGGEDLPRFNANQVLCSLDSKIIVSSDEETVQFFLSSAKAKIWKHAFQDEKEALKQVETYTGDAYSENVKKEFLQEFNTAKKLQIPEGYDFRDNEGLAEPFLMQKLIASQLVKKKRLGNWSGTGAGKTLSAVLASRIIDAQITVICCPNSVVEGWRDAVLQIYPDSEVMTKTFKPKWTKKHKYLVLNYEMFQQSYSSKRMKELVDSYEIDFIIVDEIQFVKQRVPQLISKRKQVVSSFISITEVKNPDLRVLGMSATPVINNLQEGKKLVELITGETHDDLQTKATVVNCMKLHQKLVNLGIRYMPKYDIRYEREIFEIDCEEYLDEIISDSKKGSPLTLEQILTRVRLPTIIKNLEPKTLIYTEYVTGIVDVLKEAFEKEGWKVGVFTGEEKRGLNSFIKGDTEVLIASGAIKVGVDGLQTVCNKIIMNCLPWTNSDFVQIKGRVYRQGQVRPNVKMVIPITYATVNGERWSYGEYKLQRLKFKKSISDAAVDGVVPEGHLRTPAQAYKDLMGWLERLKEGKVEIVEREKIFIPIPDEEEETVRKKRYAKYGDFSRMNRRWNQSKSSTTHERLRKNPSEWEDYHALYREAREDWEVIPYEEMIKWFDEREGYVIGDFGCGEAKIVEAFSGKHIVHSFDHIALTDDVIECDMAHVPLENESIDAAIFSLSLMGTNIDDYIKEAHRTLKLDSYLHIIEATSRFRDRKIFLEQLEQMGFTILFCKDIWKFTHICAVKTSRYILVNKIKLKL